MKRKYKMTGCAKFIIFLVIALPIAYFASSYYHGEDGLTTIKEKIGLDKILKSDNTKDPISNGQTKEMQEVVDQLQEKIKELENQNEKKDLEIKFLKSQLEAIQQQ